jgi:hypothetical protein
MSPEQRVEEFCKEYVRHGVLDKDYLDLLAEGIIRDGLKAIPAIVKILDDFDPTDSERKGNDNYDASSAAVILLGDIDLTSFRLRGSKGGRAGIDALERLTVRMRSAHFDSAPSEGERSKKIRYEITLRILGDVRGINDYDRALQDTLELRYKVKTSDKELEEFSNYLIKRDPYYPRWSTTDWYVDKKKERDGVSPWQYRIIQNIERFYKAYQNFKQ